LEGEGSGLPPNGSTRSQKRQGRIGCCYGLNSNRRELNYRPVGTLAGHSAIFLSRISLFDTIGKNLYLLYSQGLE
jgi:hypothetical protein